MPDDTRLLILMFNEVLNGERHIVRGGDLRTDGRHFIATHVCDRTKNKRRVPAYEIPPHMPMYSMAELRLSQFSTPIGYLEYLTGQCEDCGRLFVARPKRSNDAIEPTTTSGS